MNLTVGAIVVVALAIIAGLWKFGRSFRTAGQDEVRSEVAVKTVNVQSDMAKAQIDAPSGKQAVIDRLRKGGGL